MIGKKSKFEEYERQVQAGNNSEQASGERIGEKRSSSSKASADITESEYSNLEASDEFNAESKYELGEGSEEEIEETPEEIQQTGEQYKNIRSRGKDKGKDADISSVVEQPSNGKIHIITTQNIKSDTELLWDEICNGVKGKNSGIPMGFNRLNKFLGLRRSIYTTIGASAGCGKTSLVDCAYVLNPYDWYIKNKHKTNVQFEVIYFSMERKKTYKLAKWLCMKIWKEENKLLTTDQLLSWQTKLDPKSQELAKFYIDNYFKEMIESEIVKIIDGQQNPTGIFKYLKAHAKTKGQIVEINEYEERYIPDNDNLITNVVHDHAGKTKNENIGGKYDKKLTIDKASEYYCWARDFLGYSPIMINQFNRTSYQDIQFSKKEGDDPDPTVEYWKDSGNVIEDCDVAISLFNPYKYNLEDYMDYKIKDLTDTSTGNNKFRGLKILKNSYGTDNVRIGLGFLGEVGLFREMTKADQITDREINSIINNDFFMSF